MVKSPSYPVVLVGENHVDRTHLFAQWGIFKDLAALGYDMVMLEEAHNLEEPLTAYLQSKRTHEDWHAVVTAHVDASLPKPGPRPAPKNLLDRLGRSMKAFLEGDEIYLYTRLRKAEIEAIRSSSWSADTRYRVVAADRAGLRVGLCDVHSIHQRYKVSSDKEALRHVPERNAFMAEQIARAVDEGRHVIMITGSAHLSEVVSPGSSLKGELEKRGVPVVSFALPLPMERHFELPGHPKVNKKERELFQKIEEAADYQVKGPEVGLIMKKRLQAIPFERSGSACAKPDGVALCK